MNTRTDEELLCAYREGESEALRLLIERYRSELFNFLVRFVGNRAAAEDVFQEAFLQIHLSADSFDATRRLKPWLFTIAANKGRDYLRKHRRQATMELSAPLSSEDGSGEFIDLLEGDVPQPDSGLEGDELASQVRQAVDSLPAHLREILLLAYFQRFNYNQIAEALGIPLGTVKSRLHSAVATFKRKWEAIDETPDA
ncbi:MAG: sigma-70 family RNA polymerase sigma factor [Phycisphaerales bacterium]|nr:sigma-70 family RNA polymerase sigma factor [Phycisphaerales bacterium]